MSTPSASRGREVKLSRWVTLGNPYGTARSPPHLRLTPGYRVVMDLKFLNPIGKHCALQSCNVFDFLPIQCSCLQWFCRLHISPDLHDCSSLNQHPSSSQPLPSTSVRSKCAFAGCNKPSLAIAMTAVDPTQEGESRVTTPNLNGCPRCQLSFCVEWVRRHAPVSPR